jgi:hypothetical protein
MVLPGWTGLPYQATPPTPQYIIRYIGHIRPTPPSSLFEGPSTSQSQLPSNKLNLRALAAGVAGDPCCLLSLVPHMPHTAHSAAISPSGSPRPRSTVLYGIVLLRYLSDLCLTFIHFKTRGSHPSAPSSSTIYSFRSALIADYDYDL